MSPDEYNRQQAISCVNSLIDRGMEWYIYNSQIIMRIIPLIYEDSQNRL